MITQTEYQARRQALARKMPSGSVAVIPAANELVRNGDAHYRFRQDSDFYYLTGYSEPDALLLINADGESVLFNRSRDPMLEQWTGKRLGQEDACGTLLVHAAYPIASAEVRLPELFAGKHSIYYTMGQYTDWDTRIVQAWLAVKGQVRRGWAAPEALFDLAPLLSEMRLFKSQAEIDLMRKAAQISVAAHVRAMRACRHSTHEYQLEAELLYALNRQGCRSVAYDSIVASGGNACILHYTDNNSPLKPGELVLIDAGGEFENYAADITRTFPVSGQCTTEQRLIYDLVHQAQKAGIACVKPGSAWDAIQRAIVLTLTSGLVDLGLLKGDVDDLIAKEAYKLLYMHNSGHWLGLDVHDCGRYKTDGAWRTLEPGMVLTVEPGIYVRAGMDGVDKRWWDIGVRIEDDLLVTPEGHDILSAGLPSDMDEIEALLRD